MPGKHYMSTNSSPAYKKGHGSKNSVYSSVGSSAKTVKGLTGEKQSSVKK